MILAISGTPGTGKTTAAKIIARDLHANLISIGKLVSEIKHGWDKSRKTNIIDVKDLQKAINQKLEKKINIIEGHLSHLLDADVVIILRCAPPELESRLEKKRWNTKKIAENVQAEILDEITIEAVEEHGKNKVFEIDTTNRTALETTGIIKKLLNNMRIPLNSHLSKDSRRNPSYNLEVRNYHAGKIDWSEKYKDYLLKQL